METTQQSSVASDQVAVSALATPQSVPGHDPPGLNAVTLQQWYAELNGFVSRTRSRLDAITHSLPQSSNALLDLVQHTNHGIQDSKSRQSTENAKQHPHEAASALQGDPRQSHNDSAERFSAIKAKIAKQIHDAEAQR